MKKPKKYKPMQVVMMKSGSIGLPVPAQVHKMAEPGWAYVDYGALALKLPLTSIRPLTKREIG